MIHNMGGSIRKEMGAKVTHLIANCCGGEKYRYAVTFRVPIMSMNWVTALWDMKENVTCYGNNEQLVSFSSKLCKIKSLKNTLQNFLKPKAEKLNQIDRSLPVN